MSTLISSNVVPETREPWAINDSNENDPKGDFARLEPDNPAARLAFHNLYLAIQEDPEKCIWHSRHINFRPGLGLLDPDQNEPSTGDELISAPTAQVPDMVRTGFWRLNMTLPPYRANFGWTLGKGKWNLPHGNPDKATAGGIDILLGVNIENSKVHNCHARLHHSPDSYGLILAADKALRLDGQMLPRHSASVLRPRTFIELGGMRYKLTFTSLEQRGYKAQLDKFWREQPGVAGSVPPDFVDPAPSNTDEPIMSATLYQDSILKFIDEWHKDPMFNGVTEYFIVSQPLIHTNLGQLLKSRDLPRSTRLSFIEQMLAGLAFLHGNDVRCMHRDIKPENIIASTSPVRAVIIDFGLATWDEFSNNPVGTPCYMAPEVASLLDIEELYGNLYDDSRDIWEMGLTAAELMYGTRITFERISHKIYYDEITVLARGSDRYPVDTPGHWAFIAIEDMLPWEAKERSTAQKAYELTPTFKNKNQLPQLRQLPAGKRLPEHAISRDEGNHPGPSRAR